MGAACNCSKSNENIKDTVPNTLSNAISVQTVNVNPSMTVEEQQQVLATYRGNNLACMHKKVVELFNQVHAELPKGSKQLKLAALKMKEKDWDHFFVLLAFCGKLAKLNLWKVSISASSFNLLANNVMKLERLESLILNDMNIGSYPLNSLAEALKKLTALRELVLTVNYINADHLVQLTPALLQLHALETFILDENELGNRGSELLASLIERLPRITDVSLKFNSIGTKGLDALLPVIERRRGLVVRLDGNDLNDDEYDLLEQAHGIVQC